MVGHAVLTRSAHEAPVALEAPGNAAADAWLFSLLPGCDFFVELGYSPKWFAKKRGCLVVLLLKITPPVCRETVGNG